MDHIDDMEILREGIGLTAYGQRNPLVEYKMAGFDMFDEMIQNINEDTDPPDVSCTAGRAGAA